MSTNPEKAVSYVLSKYVTEYMDKDVLTLDMDTQTREAATMLRHYERDDIIVIDKQKLPIGIVTDEDILSKVSDATVYAEATTLKEIMSQPLITISDKSTLQDALHIMRDSNIRKLPIISKKNQVVGILFQSTIANAIRDATATAPRLLSPPIKAVLGNLRICITICRSIITCSSCSCNIIRRHSYCFRNLFNHSSFASYRIFPKFVWRKSKSQSTAGVNTSIC